MHIMLTPYPESHTLEVGKKFDKGEVKTEGKDASNVLIPESIG